MNILGFVSAILIIFSIISGHMLIQHKDTSSLAKSIKGYYAADLQSKNSFEEELFEAIAVSNKKKSPLPPPGDPPDAPYMKKPSFPFDLEIKKEEKEEKTAMKPKKIYECSCFNLYPLIKNGKKEEKALYDLLASFIKLLYQEELSQKDLEYKFLDALLVLCQKKIEKNEELYLAKLTFTDPLFQDLWYKMVRGTKFYDFDKQLGFPSILDFLTIQESKNKKICLVKAPKEILSVLFSKEITEKLIQKREKDKTITKNFLEKLLAYEYGFSSENLSNVLNLLHFTHSAHLKMARCIVCTDEATQIAIKRNY